MTLVIMLIFCYVGLGSYHDWWLHWASVLKAIVIISLASPQYKNSAVHPICLHQSHTTIKADRKAWPFTTHECLIIMKKKPHAPHISLPGYGFINAYMIVSLT